MGTSKKLYLLICVLVVISSSHVSAQASISSREARNHIGESGTVCGKVESTHFAFTSRGQPTFLNLDGAYPNQVFTIVIWGNDRSKFGEPENRYRDLNVCVTGEIKLYRGVPQIIATEPAQIKNGKHQ